MQASLLRVAFPLAIALACLFLAQTIAAQAPPAPVEVSFSCNNCEFNQEEVQKAILAEVQSLPAASQSSGKLLLRLDQRHLFARFESASNRVLEREMDLPVNRSRALQAIALLAANLVRDEAADLLAGLRPPPVASASAVASAPPVSSASATPPPPSAPMPTLKIAPIQTQADPPKPLPRKIQPLNLSLFHPWSLYPSSHKRAFYAEVGLLYGRVGEVHGGSIALGGTVADRANGLMIGALGNWSKGSFEGVQFAGIANVAGDQSAGTQIAPFNLAGQSWDGVQVGLINISTGRVRGAQVGLFNWAGDLSGTQLGLVNVAKKFEGFPVGVVSANHTGHTQVLVWSSTSMLGNLGLRYLHKYVFTLLAVGMIPAAESLGGNGTAKVGWQTGLGGRIPAGRLYFELDAGYAHEGAASSAVPHSTSSSIPHLQVFRYRGVFGWEISRAFGVFVGGGLRHEFSPGSAMKTRPEGIAGIQLL